MNELRYCVYVHTNKKNGKKYVGITRRNPIVRWNNGKGYYYNSKFYNSIKKNGWDSFSHEVLYEDLTQEEALLLEEELIKKYNSVDNGYNNKYSDVSNHDQFSDETKAKMSKAHMGKPSSRKGIVLDNITKHKISSTLISKYESGEITSGRKGHINSPEMRKKISESCKGRSVWNKGLKTGPQSKESNEKRSASLKGHLTSAETRKKIGDAQRGPLNHMYGKTSAMGKKCININTGKIYDSLHKCAEGDHINYSDLQRGLKNNHGVYECYRYVEQN